MRGAGGVKAFSRALVGGGVGCLLGALYAVAYSRPAATCSGQGACDIPAPNHPYAGLAIALVVVSLAALGLALILNRHRL